MIHHHSNGAQKARERRRKERRQKPKQLHIFSEYICTRPASGGSAFYRFLPLIDGHAQTPHIFADVDESKDDLDLSDRPELSTLQPGSFIRIQLKSRNRQGECLSAPSL
ncbi:hypothetical protein MHYP_G00091260 [Metynnis hypsauchen]